MIVVRSSWSLRKIGASASSRGKFVEMHGVCCTVCSVCAMFSGGCKATRHGFWTRLWGTVHQNAVWISCTEGYLSNILCLSLRFFVCLSVCLSDCVCVCPLSRSRSLSLSFLPLSVSLSFYVPFLSGKPTRAYTQFPVAVCSFKLVYVRINTMHLHVRVHINSINIYLYLYLYMFIIIVTYIYIYIYIYIYM